MLGLRAELHDSGGEVLHFEGVDDLVAVRVVGRADVDDAPVEDSGEGVETLEGDVEAEGIENRGRVVAHCDVVDVDLGHICRSIRFGL